MYASFCGKKRLLLFLAPFHSKLKYLQCAEFSSLPKSLSQPRKDSHTYYLCCRASFPIFRHCPSKALYLHSSRRGLRPCWPSSAHSQYLTAFRILDESWEQHTTCPFWIISEMNTGQTPTYVGLIIPQLLISLSHLSFQHFLKLEPVLH